MKRNSLILMLLCPFFTAACTGVDFNPERPEEQCSLVLKTGDEDILSARALLSRTINEVHYLCDVDETKSYDVEVGEYCAVAFACDETLFDLEEVNNFAESRAVPLKQIKVYAHRTDQQKMLENLQIDSGDIADMAISYPVVECTEPLYQSFIKRTLKPSTRTTDEEPESSSADTISFKFEDATLSLNFNIQIETDEGVEIECVLGCITGIPSYLYVMDGETDRSSLAKTFFKLEDNGSGLYSGTIRTFGLFLPENEEYLSGNGIVVTYIIAKTAEIRRVIHPTPLNLKKYYQGAEIMKPSATGGHFILSSHSEIIQLPSETISKERIFSTDKESAKWIMAEGDSLQVDDINPFIPWVE